MAHEIFDTIFDAKEFVAEAMNQVGVALDMRYPLADSPHLGDMTDSLLDTLDLLNEAHTMLHDAGISADQADV